MGVALVLLVIAIAVEVVSTAFLPRTEGFRDPFWAAIVLTGYAVAIWLLALVVQRLPVSVTYAVWSGLGTAAIAVIGVLFLGESWNPVKVTAITLIVVGVVMLNLQTAH
jgi:small multidrug resistance pump